MRILLIHNEYQQKGGEDSVVSTEKELLEKNNHFVKDFLIKNHDINNLYSKIKVALNAVYSKKYRDKIKIELEKNKIDIMHVHNFFPLITPSVYDAGIEVKVPVIQTLHNYRTLCSNALFIRNDQICELCLSHTPYYAVLHRCYRNSIWGSFAVARMVNYHRKNKTWQKKVNRFITLTEFGKKKFMGAAFPEQKISVKPNFIEDPLDSKNSINNRKQSALFVGRLSHEKGIKILIEAWKNINYPLNIAGDGPLFEELKQTASDNISFLGHLSKKEILYHMMESSFLVMPSIWYEGFPVVLVESFACGLPVVASKLGSMAEIIQNGITGMHFEPGNPENLSETVKYLISSPGKLKQMGINARTEYEARYTPEKNYQILMEIYNTVIKEHKNI